MNKVIIIALSLFLLGACTTDGTKDITDSEIETRDLSWFLKRLRTLNHLPELENSHTAMVSTWDTTGNNLDAFTHNWNVEEDTNTILDIDGPGCIHRIFTGYIDHRFDSTRIQIYLDHKKKPLFDMPITKFFDDRYSPFPYPLVFVKSYPGTLMPIPFEKNITVKIVTSPFRAENWKDGPHSEALWNLGRWGVYWQFTYTKYSGLVKVKSMNWPLDDTEQSELDKTCYAWLKAESTPPSEPDNWDILKKTVLHQGESMEVNIENTGVIKQLRIVASPDNPEVLNHIRIQMFWDGNTLPSVDAPIGYMFGHGESGQNKNDSSIAAVNGKWPVSDEFMQTEPQPYNTNYNSLLPGMTNDEVYCRFPMPFSDGAKVKLLNTGNRVAEHVELKIEVEKMKRIPENWGRFQVTWSQAPAATGATPKFGEMNIPCKIFLDRKVKGKYVGSMLQIAWDSNDWWGEGDWLIWTDENEWPPSYHGTGTEEYFNSGWGMFDRKAVSGFVSLRPGHPTVYSFHLNDAFNFQYNIRVVEEQWALVPNETLPNQILATKKPMWSSTAFWYAEAAVGAESQN